MYRYKQPLDIRNQQMIIKICFYFLHSVFFIFSLLLLCLATTSAASLGHQFVAVRGGHANGVINKCIDKEKHALLDFKARLEDPRGILFTWRVEDDCCKWSGVTCNNQTGHVTKLDLSFYFIQGTLGGEISHSLLNLSYLNHLDLSDNFINGTIPWFIGSMTQLRYLDLGWNHFNGAIPKFIGSMTQLRYLNLGWNRFNGTIPKSIGSMTQLRYLNLGDNLFNGTIPKYIGSMTQLRYLNLGWNHFNGAIPKFIGSMTQLRYLHLMGNHFSGTIPPELGNLTNLRGLGLGSFNKQNFTIENLDWLSHLSHLQQLDMDGISLAKANHWVNVISSLRKLSFLVLRRCELSQVMYPYSSSFVNSSSSTIDILDLSDNNLNSSMYHWLFPLTSNILFHLDLSNNTLDGIPKYLGNLCSLTYLSIYGNSAVVEFPDFLKNLSGCTAVTLQELHATGSDTQLQGEGSSDQPEVNVDQPKVNIEPKEIVENRRSARKSKAPVWQRDYVLDKY